MRIGEKMKKSLCLKSRVCKNCKYFESKRMMCRIAYAAFNHPIWELNENIFGCNMFKRKENDEN